MGRTILLLIALACSAGGGAYFMHRYHQPTPEAPVVVHESTRPTIEQVRELADLVVLDVPISDVHVSRLEGMTGGLRMAVAVRGDVQIAADLDKARFEAMDEELKAVVLVLERPRPQRPRVDHEKTRILEVERTGLWRVLHGQAGEDVLTDRAFAAAQRVLAEVAKDPELVAQACGRTERVLRAFFEAVGWTVQIQWEDGATASAG